MIIIMPFWVDRIRNNDSRVKQTKKKKRTEENNTNV